MEEEYKFGSYTNLDMSGVNGCVFSGYPPNMAPDVQQEFFDYSSENYKNLGTQVIKKFNEKIPDFEWPLFRQFKGNVDTFVCLRLIRYTLTYNETYNTRDDLKKILNVVNSLTFEEMDANMCFIH